MKITFTFTYGHWEWCGGVLRSVCMGDVSPSLRDTGMKDKHLLCTYKSWSDLLSNGVADFTFPSSLSVMQRRKRYKLSQQLLRYSCVYLPPSLPSSPLLSLSPELLPSYFSLQSKLKEYCITLSLACIYSSPFLALSLSPSLLPSSPFNHLTLSVTFPPQKKKKKSERIQKEQIKARSLCVISLLRNV